jgi:hypothetical protein
MLSPQPEKGPYLGALPPWEDLDYFRRRRRLRVRRIWFTLTASLLALGFGVWSLWPSHHAVHEAGPVSTVHASFGNDCGKCHTAPFATLERLVLGDAPSVKNEQCSVCHLGAIHHPQQRPNPMCVECHHEHRGHAQLARVADGQCTVCHGDLANHRMAHATPGVRNEKITRFDVDHPEFGTSEVRPAKLAFDHGTHLAADLGHLRAHGGAIPERYGDRLDCKVCHAADAAGRFMQSIKYDKHCADCHPLRIQVEGGLGPLTAAEREAFERTPVPHAAPAIVRGAILERYADLIRQHPDLVHGPAKSGPEFLLPGRGFRPLREEDWAWVKDRATSAEKPLFAPRKPDADQQAGKATDRLTRYACAVCHQVKSPSIAVGLPEIESPRAPERWYPRSTFHHERHRMLDCRECHPLGSLGSGGPTADSLLPSKASCQKCHHAGPSGARSDCIECHRYHDRGLEHGFHGRQAIESFLRDR